jgi:oxidoreductase
MENFVKIDKDYVINAAKLIREQNPTADLQFLYCSSAGANPDSSFLYMKTKGEIERELAEIGFNKVTIFRPGFLKADRVRVNFSYIELLFVLLVNLFDYVIPKKAIVHVDIVGRGKLLVFFFLSFPFFFFI